MKSIADRMVRLVLLSIGATIASLPCVASAQDAPVQAGQNDEQRKMEIRTTGTIRLEKRVGGCRANLSLEYWQEGHLARVNTTISNNECAASGGEYRIRIVYRGDDGEAVTDEYDESWERDDERTVSVSRTYEIGDDVDLLRVRSRGLTCACR